MHNKDFDPVLMAVLANRFEAITKEMVNTLLRSGRSGVINMGRDFSCAIVTADGRLFFSGEGLPIHVVGIELVAQSMTQFFDDIKEGDAFIHNSPYHGNSHHGDLVILVPIFYNGKHVFTALAKAHQADIGNSLPTTYMPNAKDIYEEGSLNFPCVRIQENYKDKKDIIRMIRMRIRVPDQWYGDYLAQLGSARICERRIKQLIDKYGLETIERFQEEWFKYSERRMVEEIKKWPWGTWQGTTKHDPIPAVPLGVEFQVKITVDPDEAYITVDLRDNPDCVKGGLNQSRACATSNTMIGIFNCMDPTLPHNDGSLRRIKVLLRENCVVGIPVHPTSCSMATTNIADRMVNLTQATLSQMGEGWGLAEGGVGMPPTVAVISGQDWRKDGAPYINQLELAFNGGPGLDGTDGWLNYGQPVVAGLMYRDSVEVDEQKYPMHIYEQKIITDSEGAGQWRGAPGAKVVYGPKKDPMTVIYTNDGHSNPPRGVHGGKSPAPEDVWKYNIKWEKVEVPQTSAEVLNAGEAIVSISSGGGGYGDPLDRDPDLVRWDAREGLITVERAKEVYGVVLDTGLEQYRVDYEATQKLRRQMKGGA